MLIRLFQFTVGVLDWVAALIFGTSSRSAQLLTGRRGEEAAYFHLRRHGYVIVARNFRSRRRRGEVDLVGWDGDVLCFIEVKTRTTHDVKPPEAAVDRDKQRELVAMARDFCRRTVYAGRTGAAPARIRFDIVSVYFEGQAGTPQITLFKNAFSMT